MNIIKKLLGAVIVLTSFIFFTNCSKESYKPEETIVKTIELNFNNGSIKEKLYLEKGIWVSKSKTLIKKEYKDSQTGQISYGFALEDKIGYRASSKKSQAFSIERGLFGWNGTCFLWGTLITGDNGESIFIPADYETQKLLNVCPDEGGAYAKKKDNEIKMY